MGLPDSRRGPTVPSPPISMHCFVAGERVLLASARHSPEAAYCPQDKVLSWDEALHDQALANSPVLIILLSLTPHPCPAWCDPATLKFL